MDHIGGCGKIGKDLKTMLDSSLSPPKFYNFDIIWRACDSVRQMVCIFCNTEVRVAWNAVVEVRLLENLDSIPNFTLFGPVKSVDGQYRILRLTSETYNLCRSHLRMPLRT